MGVQRRAERVRCNDGLGGTHPHAFRDGAATGTTFVADKWAPPRRPYRGEPLGPLHGVMNARRLLRRRRCCLRTPFWRPGQARRRTPTNGRLREPGQPAPPRRRAVSRARIAGASHLDALGAPTEVRSTTSGNEIRPGHHEGGMTAHLRCSFTPATPGWLFSLKVGQAGPSPSAVSRPCAAQRLEFSGCRRQSAATTG